MGGCPDQWTGYVWGVEGSLTTQAAMIQGFIETESDWSWANNDPYANAGLFSGVELIVWKKVI